MKNLVLLSVVLFVFATSGCTRYEEDQQIFDQVAELEAAEALILNDKTDSSGGNPGSNPR